MTPTMASGEEGQEFELRDGTLEYSGLAAKKRVTLVVPTNLDLNLEFLSMISGQLKMEIVTRALQEFLVKKGIPDPLAQPVISWKPRTPASADDAGAEAARGSRTRRPDPERELVAAGS